VGLWRTSQIVEIMDRVTKPLQPPGTRVEFRDDKTSWQTTDVFVVVPLSRRMPLWAMALHVSGSEFTDSARRPEAVYLWTGSVGVGRDWAGIPVRPAVEGTVNLLVITQ
jgi:hypothetical protein